MSVFGSAKSAKLAYHQSSAFSKNSDRSNEMKCFVQEIVIKILECHAGNLGPRCDDDFISNVRYFKVTRPITRMMRGSKHATVFLNFNFQTGKIHVFRIGWKQTYLLQIHRFHIFRCAKGHAVN